MDGVQLDRAAEAIVNAENSDPFSYLGAHKRRDKIVIRAFLPDADDVWVVGYGDGGGPVRMERVRDAGLFAIEFPDAADPISYRLRVRWGDDVVELEDPYRFGSVLGDLDRYFLAEGSHMRAYEKLGAHPIRHEGVDGTLFCVWAPNARRVSVVGEFNAWDGRRHPMRSHPGCGVWELFVPGVGEQALYKYEILGTDGTLLPLKSDPVAFRGQLRPETASVVHDLDGYAWRDGDWMDCRGERHNGHAPVSIYEVHLGSWQRVVEEGYRSLTYVELADRLIPYAVEMGFTHLELLPITEHPFDGSWGYQPIGLYAPTSRYGTPNDFRRFIDRCHQAGLGVIVDWVPSHFPDDAHGPAWFDGTHLYEHADPRQGRHTDWGTLIYNFGRSEVANHLLANALFWLDQYHVDGLRVDAVASMLYLDYSRKSGEWIPNVYGGNENLEAIAFLRRLNEQIYERHPDVFTIAEESTAWPMVSRPTYVGGLGFGFKWNMGWMHDTLRFMSRDPIFRRFHLNDLTFGLLYAFQENFVLPLSHDEVVHGKGSIINRMPGDRWQRFANLRAYYAFMWTHPGKKLLFMGGEFGQEREWNHNESLDWHLLDDPHHDGVRLLMRDLNALYRSFGALHANDHEAGGFEWIDCSDHEKTVLSFVRNGRSEDDSVVVVCNFTPEVREGYRIGVSSPGYYHEVLNTDAERYGGSNVGNYGGVHAEAVPVHGQAHSVALRLPPLAVVILQAEPDRP